MQLWSVAHFHPHFWVGLLLHPPKSEYGNGQLTRVAFKINDFLWNPHFSGTRGRILKDFHDKRVQEIMEKDQYISTELERSFVTIVTIWIFDREPRTCDPIILNRDEIFL